jgi:class 3 adenylate cyclase
MSDVEGSGRHWTANASAMGKAVQVLDHAVGTAVEHHGGFVLKQRGEGDSHFAVFNSPSEAVMAAGALHSLLDRASATDNIDLRVRVGVHLGEARATGNDYYGLAVNQTARLRSVAHGGQTVLSRAAAAIAEPTLAAGVRLRSLGYHRLRDFPRIEEVFQATAVGARDSFPPLRTGATRSPAVLAVVLVDICGASAAARSGPGPVDVIALQRGWATLLREVSVQHSCAALKLLGDGCLAAFEDPLDARAFASAIAVAVAKSGLQVRVGMDAGRVEVIDGEVVGEAVLAAAELCRHADAGQVLTTPALRDLLGTAATARPAGPYTLRSLERTIQLFEL